MTIVLALDQSTQNTGYAWRDDSITDGDFGGYHWGIFKNPPEKKRLSLTPVQWQLNEMRQLIKRVCPDVVAIETVQVTTARGREQKALNIKTALMLAEFRGRVVGMCEDTFGIPTMDVSSADMSAHLHLSIGAPRATKKSRSQYTASVMVMGYVYANDAGNPLIPEDAADALNILAIAEGRWELERKIKEAN